MSFTGLLTGAEIAQKPTPAWVTVHKAGKLGHITACRQLNTLVCPLRCLGQSKPLSGSLAGFCLFQTAGLVSESSLQFGLPETLLSCFASLRGLSTHMLRVPLRQTKLQRRLSDVSSCKEDSKTLRLDQCLEKAYTNQVT